MITAGRAGKEGRMRLAVPGNIYARNSAGPNNILRSAGTPIVTVSDAIVAMGFHSKEAKTVSAQSPEEAQLMKLIGKTEATTEELIAQSGMSAAQFANMSPFRLVVASRPRPSGVRSVIGSVLPVKALDRAVQHGRTDGRSQSHHIVVGPNPGGLLPAHAGPAHRAASRDKPLPD